MEIIGSDGRLSSLKPVVRKESGAKDKRASLVEYFVLPINDERVKNKLKPLSKAFIAIKMAHIHEDDLFPFFKRCVECSNKANGSFGKAWWGSLKVKP